MLEKEFLDYVIREAAKLGISQRQLAAKALMEGRKSLASAERALYSMLGVTASGKRQRITLQEAEKLSTIIGERLPYLLMKVQFLVDQIVEKQAGQEVLPEKGHQSSDRPREENQ